MSLLVIDEWLLDKPDASTSGLLLELLNRRYGWPSTKVGAQYGRRGWHQRLGTEVLADPIIDRIVHNTIWVKTGRHNMR